MPDKRIGGSSDALRIKKESSDAYETKKGSSDAYRIFGCLEMIRGCMDTYVEEKIFGYIDKERVLGCL